MGNKRLIIDGQVFQTEAKDRGMGRYSACLTQALIKNKTYSKIEILLTKNLKLTRQAQQELNNLFPTTQMTYLDLQTTNKHKIEEAFTYNYTVLNKYIKRYKDEGVEIDYLIPSLFQEPIVSVFPKGTKKILLFYDLIPYLYHFRYRAAMQYEDYLKRYKYVFEADRIFTISLSIADDLHTFLGIPRKRLTCIDGAPIRTDHTTSEPTSFVTPERFVLMPTSDDPRKNNLRGVLGFEEYCATSGRQDLKLIITSTIHKREREHLSYFSKNLVFTGNLRAPELNWLYKECATVLFAPESEGLGLPVLEGVEANKKVVCSSLGVFKEISEDAFYYCNYENQQSIAEALGRALDQDQPIPSREYKRILSHYNWAKTADRLIKSVLNTQIRKESSYKPKVAIFTPTSDGFSAIGKVVAESHPTMTEYFDVDYFVENGLYAKPVRPNYLQYVAPCYRAQDFSAERYAEYDAIIYHIGNGDYHLESIKNGLYLPGYAVLHDTNIKEAYRVLKDIGMMDESRVKVEEHLDNTVQNQTSRHLVSLLNNQLGILSHSDYAYDATKQVAPNDTPVIKANLPTAVPELTSIKESDRPVIGLAGIIADVKGIEVIEAIANDTDFNNCDIRLFGFSYASQETIDRLNSYDNVIVATNLSDFDFQKSISKLDVFVNYRLRYNGETSLSTIEAMRQGVVVLVRKIGWYDELPDNTVIKVKNTKEVPIELKKLINNKGLINIIGKRAKQYIAKEYGHEQYAQKLQELIKKSAKSDDSNHNLAKRLKNKQIKSLKQYLNFLKNKKI